MSLSNLIVSRPKTIAFIFIFVSILIGSQTMVLITNITLDPRDYLPANAESIQILNEISQEMAGIDLLGTPISPSAISGADIAMPIMVYVKSERDLTELDSILELSNLERLIAEEFESRGVISVQSYASFITQITEFYGGEKGKIPPIIDLMNFLESHEISLADIAKLTSTFSMPTDEAEGTIPTRVFFIVNLPDPLLNGLEWSFNLCFRLLSPLIQLTGVGTYFKEIFDFLNTHNISFVDIKELLQIVNRGSTDPQADLNFMFSLIPESLLNLLLASEHTETIMTINVEMDALSLEQGRGGGILMGNEKLAKLEQDIGDLLSNNAPDWIEFTVAGPAAMEEEMTNFMLKWLGILIPASLGAIAISIFIFHRNWKSVLLVLLPTFAGIALNLGTLGLLPMSFAFEDVVVAPCLIAFGFAYSLHLVNRFSEEVEIHDPEEAIRRTLSTTGKAVLLSAVTTMVGFASLMITPLSMIAKMGFVFVLGILYLYLSAIILVPCLLLILKYRKKGKNKEWKKTLRITAHPKIIISMTLLITILSILSIPHISTEVDLFAIDPPADLYLTRKAMDYTEKLGMGQPGVLMVRGDITDPDLAADIEDLEMQLSQLEYVISAYSVLDFMKPFNLGQTPTGDQVKLILDSAGETISEMMAGIGRASMGEIFLTRTIIMIDMPRTNIEITGETIHQINEIIDSYTLTNGSATHITGLGAIMWDLHSLLLPSQIESIVFAIIAVFVCMVIVFKSFKYGIFTLIPLSLVVLWEPLLLVALRVPLSVITVAIASITIGTGIDFGVHITERIREEIERGKSGTDASRIAVMTTSLSLFETIFAVCLGLLPIYLLNMEIINQFITVIILMLIIACVSAMILLPTIYMTYYRRVEKVIRK